MSDDMPDEETTSDDLTGTLHEDERLVGDVSALSGANNPLAFKIARISKQILRVAKRGHNNEFNYDFARDSDIIEAARGPMNDAHVAIFPSILPDSVKIVTGLGRNQNMILTTCVVEFTITDGESGFEKVCNFPGAGIDSQDKGIYKAMTGATKYFYQKLFNIPTGDDPEQVPLDPGDPGPDDDIDAAMATLPAASAVRQRPATQAARPAAQPAPAAQKPASVVKPTAAQKPAATQRAAAAAPAPAVVLVVAITPKQGTNAKGPWTLYTVKFSGKVRTSDGSVTDNAGTFEDSIALEAESARDAKTPVMPIITSKKNARGYVDHLLEGLDLPELGPQ